MCLLAFFFALVHLAIAIIYQEHGNDRMAQEHHLLLGRRDSATSQGMCLGTMYASGLVSSTEDVLPCPGS